MNTVHRGVAALTKLAPRAVVAGGVGLAAMGLAVGTAHAQITTYPIASPSGNIACILYADSLNGPELGSAVCDIRQYSWAAPALPAACRFPHGPVFYLTQRADNQDPATMDQCGPGNAGIYTMPGLQALAWGQTRTVGAITCDSAPSGISCTDANSGHFFRVSSDSYQLG
jgi:hypothetical protein